MKQPSASILSAYFCAVALCLLGFFGFILKISPGFEGIVAVLFVISIFIIFRVKSEEDDDKDLSFRQVSQIGLLQAELAQQQNVVDELADGLNVAIFICESDGSILYANQRAKEFFRIDSPRNRSVLAATLSYDLESLVLQVIKKEGFQSSEINFSYPEERVGRAVAWKTGPKSQIFLSIYEITDLKRLERIRKDFVANVSHELRTPLTVIRVMAETLLDDTELPLEKKEQYYERIITEVDRLSLISSDLLILSSAESSPIRKHACNLASVWRNTIVSLTDKAMEKNIHLSYKGPEIAMVEANETQMTQVAVNLIDNAINYTPARPKSAESADPLVIKIEFQVVGDKIRIDVTDAGIGIHEQDQDRIFERFYRVDKARSRSSGGTGLGLSIVKHITEAHGGTVSLKSELNRGSMFTVSLPIGDPNSEF